jgi:hypothetical protein
MFKGENPCAGIKLTLLKLREKSRRRDTIEEVMG